MIPYNPQVKPPMWAGPEVMAANVQRWHDKKGLPHPVLFLPLWEGSGNRVWDLSGWHKRGVLNPPFYCTLEGTAHFTAEGVEFHGVDNNDYIATPPPNEMPRGSVFVLFRMTQYDSSVNTVFSYAKGIAADIRLGVQNDGDIEVELTAQSSVVRGTYTLNDISSIVFTWASGNAYVYKDGAQQGAVYSYAGTPGDSSKPFVFGAYRNDFDIVSQEMDGTIYVAAIYTEALSEAQAKVLYEEPYGALYPVDQTSYLGPLIIEGTICWGHDTGVTQTNIRDFSGNWTGTGAISGSGDSEVITLDDGEYMESEIVNIGVKDIEILIDDYGAGSGPAETVQYKDGATEAACEADSWHNYTVPFRSAGYVKVRVEN